MRSTYILFIVLCLISSGVSLAHQGGAWSGNGWRHMTYFGYGGLLVWSLVLIVVGLLIFIVIMSVMGRRSGDSSRETPMEILKKRYAKGEIAKEEYDRMKKDLEG